MVVRGQFVGAGGSGGRRAPGRKVGAQVAEGAATPVGLGAGDDDFEAVRQLVLRLWSGGGSGPQTLGAVWLALRHRQTLRNLNQRIDGLPAMEIRLGDGPGGREIGRLLMGPRGRLDAYEARPSLRSQLATKLLLVPDRRSAVSVLSLPEDPAAYRRGRSRQAVRTNVRRAGELGITVGEIRGAEGRRRHLLRVLGERGDGWMAEHGEWIGDRLGEPWLRFFAACGPLGDPLAVSVVVAEGLLALLRLGVSVRNGASTYARYALHVYMVEALIRSGARWMLVESVFETEPGLRYFQHLLGFRVVRARVVSGPTTGGEGWDT